MGSYQKIDPGYWVAVDEGNAVGQTILYTTVQECEEICNQINQCNSFAHCPEDANKCWLKDKKVVQSEAIRYQGYCTTYFRHANCTGMNPTFV